MAPKRIFILQGHPDGTEPHLCAALADAYAAAAQAAGHELRRIDLAGVEFRLLRSEHDFQSGTPAPPIAAAQAAIAWAEHLVVFFPLWFGGMPALLKGFLEQVGRPGFAFTESADGTAGPPAGRLGGRSARLVVTMGMPSWAYRWLYGAPVILQLRRSILGLAGIRPVRATLLGSVAAVTAAHRAGWLRRMAALGRAGA